MNKKPKKYANVLTNKERWKRPDVPFSFCFKRGKYVYTSVYSQRQATGILWRNSNKEQALAVLIHRYNEYIDNKQRTGSGKTLTIAEAIKMFHKMRLVHITKGSRDNYYKAFETLLNQNNLHINQEAEIRNHVNESIEILKANGRKGSYINLLITLARSFFQFFVEERYLKYNPISKHLKAVEAKTENKFFTDEEQKAILNYAETYKAGANSKQGHDAEFRDITRLLFLTGARIAEILNIRNEQIKDDHLLIEGKGSRNRIFPYFIAPEMETILKNRKTSEPKQQIFIMEYQTYNARYNRMIKTLFGLTPKSEDFKPIHTIRKTVTNIFREKGINVEARSMLIGHSIEIETNIYNKTPDAKTYRGLIGDFTHNLLREEDRSLQVIELQ